MNRFALSNGWTGTMEGTREDLQDALLDEIKIIKFEEENERV